MSLFGYKIPVAGHDKRMRLLCPNNPPCSKSFGSKGAHKKHMREIHPTAEEKKKLNI